MKLQTNKGLLIACCLLVNVCFNANAQTTISGPTCGMTGIACQYLITGKWTNTSKMELCIKNGKLESGEACYNGQPVPYIRVKWNENATNGSISVNAAEGNASLDVKIARPLRAGMIDEASQKQEIKYDKIPSPISCSPASGGTCDPVFNYQWQESSDQVKWTDLSGQTGKNLVVSVSKTRTVFYRRKVTETRTKTIGFSTVAAVFVKGREK